MKKTPRTIFLFLAVVFTALLLWAPTQYVVPVITYHSIAPDYIEPLNNVRPERFTRQMDFLKKNRYKVISIAELVKGLKSGRKFDLNAVVITFDDGLENNYTTAYPILKARGLPATMFIPSDEVGRPARLTWDQIREMAANGIIIGSHTRTGSYTPEISGSRMVDEITGSKAIIEKNVGRPVDFFAYPIGGYNEEAITAIRAAGYQAAFTTNRGFNKNTDLFALRRIHVKDTDNEFIMMFKMSGYYNFFRSVRRPY